jgi:two-component system alkaline phosphatase synthesis response regulator PhoP
MATKATKILVIDDQAFFTTMLKNLLEQQGYQVVAAGGGQQGLDQARKEQPDVVLLDIKMPGMDGFQVCQQMKKDAALKHIPVIILTATDDAKLNEKAFAAGADITALKNLPGDRLINILKFALGKGKPTE